MQNLTSNQLYQLADSLDYCIQEGNAFLGSMQYVCQPDDPVVKACENCVALLQERWTAVTDEMDRRFINSET